MLLMIEKPRATPAERAGAALRFALGHAARGSLAALDAALGAPFRILENRRLVDALAAMSDRDLRDIGLVRGDLRDAAALPGGRDAGVFLAGRRADRRLRR